MDKIELSKFCPICPFGENLSVMGVLDGSANRLNFVHVANRIKWVSRVANLKTGEIIDVAEPFFDLAELFFDLADHKTGEIFLVDLLQFFPMICPARLLKAADF